MGEPKELTPQQNAIKKLARIQAYLFGYSKIVSMRLDFDIKKPTLEQFARGILDVLPSNIGQLSLISGISVERERTPENEGEGWDSWNSQDLVGFIADLERQAYNIP